MTDQTLGLFVLLFLFFVAGFFYFIPTIIAFRKRDVLAIFVLNVLAGWTFVGWVIALVWACRDDRL